MKNKIIIGLSSVLAACSTASYVTDVTTESYKEDYQVPKIEQPIMSDSQNNVTEVNVVRTAQPQTQAATQPAKPQVTIMPPSSKQVAHSPRYGYTIQVVAVGLQRKVDQFAAKLPRDGQPIWENYKIVKGTKWYTILFGDYATKNDARAAIANLPAGFKRLKPFVKSIDEIKNSDYPTMNKLN